MHTHPTTAAVHGQISDFGMARDLTGKGEESEYYQSSRSATVPVRWTAIEAFEEKKFSEKTDVWVGASQGFYIPFSIHLVPNSNTPLNPRWHGPTLCCAALPLAYSQLLNIQQAFGILCHEVFTGGQKPYIDMNNETVFLRVSSGYRLQCPIGCPQAVYDGVMQRCWRTSPSQRPTFAQLTAFLRQRVQRDGAKNLLQMMSERATEDSRSLQYPGASSSSSAVSFNSTPPLAPRGSADYRHYLGLEGGDGRIIHATTTVDSDFIPLAASARPRGGSKPLLGAVKQARSPESPRGIGSAAAATPIQPCDVVPDMIQQQASAPSGGKHSAIDCLAPTAAVSWPGHHSQAAGVTIAFEEEDDVLYI